MKNFHVLSVGHFLIFLVAIFFQVSALAQAPTTPSSNFYVTNNDGDRFILRFTAGDGARRLVIASTNPITAVPQDGADYVANSTYGLGNELEAGEFVVYSGSGSSTWIYGLNHSTTYHFRVYEFNGTDYNTQYLTSEYLDGSGTTLSGPTVQASGLSYSNITGTSMTISWTNGDGTGRFLVGRAGSAVEAEPQDLTYYSDYSRAFAYPTSSSYSIGTNDQKILYQGSGSSVTIYNLDPNVTYNFALFEYNGSSGKVYKRPGAIGNQLTNSYPTTASSNAFFTNVDGDRFIPRWTSGDGEKRIVIAKKGSAVTSIPVDGATYSADPTFGAGQPLNEGEFVVYNGTGTSHWLYGLEPSTTYHIAIFEYNGSGENTFYLKDPYLASSQTTLTGPTVQASGLTFSNITGTSMTISWTNGDGTGRFLVGRAGSAIEAEPQDLTYYSDYSRAFAYPTSSSYSIGTNDQKVLYQGSGSSVTIYNLDPNVTYNFALFEYNGSSGKVYKRPGAIGNQLTNSYPTTASSNAYFTNVDGDRFIPRWTSGDGEKRIVIAKKGSAVTSIPVDGATYSADPTFGAGQPLNEGEFVVYNGTGTSHWLYGLEPSTTYHIAIFEYNGSGENTFYLKDPYLASSQTTLTGPTVQASGLTFSNITGTSMTISWTNGDGTGRFLVGRAGSAVEAEPQDLTYYSDYSRAFAYPTSSSYSIGTNDQKVLYQGSGSSVTIYNLDPNVTYNFALFEYNGSSGKVYKRPGAIGNQLTNSYPTTASSNAYFTHVDGDRFIPRWTSGDGEKRIVIAKKGSAVTSIPVDGATYSADPTFGAGQPLNEGEFVVYNGTGTSHWLYGLEPSTTYHIAIFEYNESGDKTYYLIDPYLSNSQSTLSAPSVQSSNAFLSSRSTTSLNVSWTKGNGSYRILIGRKDGPVNIEPEDLKSYNAYSSYGYYNTEIGASGNFALYSSSGNNVNITNLEAGTNYHFALFEYNGSNGKLYQRPGYAFALETFGERPTAQVSNAQFSNITFSSFDVSMTAGNGSRRLVLAREGGPVSSGLEDFTNYTASSTFGQGTEIGSGNYVVYNDFGENFSLTGLDPGKNYHFAFYEYSMSADGELYMAPSYTASQTTLGAPTQIATNFAASASCTTEPTLTWTAGNGSGRIVVMSPEELNTLPVNYTNYSSNITYGSGDALGNGFVVYSGAAETITINGLQEFTNYQVNIFEYNGTAESPYFNTTPLRGALGDIVAPTIAVVEEQTASADSECRAVLDDYTALAVVEDNCDEAPVVTQLPTVGTIISSTTPITLKVTDAFGNSEETTFNVVIKDDIAPSLATIGNQIVSPDSNCNAVLPDYTALAMVSDNCDFSPEISQDPLPGTVLTEAIPVTITATDAGGNQNSVSFNVSVESQSAPEIACLTDQTVQLAQEECTYIHNDTSWDVLQAAGCGEQSLQSQFSSDLQGWTKYTVSDASASVTWISGGGNPGGFIRFNEPGQGTVDYFMAPTEFLGSKSGYYGGSVSVDIKSNQITNSASMIELTGNGITILSSPDRPLQTWENFELQFLPGNWTVQGSGASASEEDIRNVLGNLEKVLIRADWFNGSEVTDLDNFKFIPGPPSFDLAGATIGSGNSLNGLEFNAGETVVTWTAVNSAGVSSCSFTVTVEDKLLPSIVAPVAVSANTSIDGAGNCTAKVELGSPDTYDNCEIKLIETYIGEQKISLDHAFPTGLTVVTWKVTDGAGNISSATQEVTILDDENPVIPTPDPVALTEEESKSFILPSPAASDNCEVLPLLAYVDNVQTDLSQYSFNLGTTMVTWIAKDTAGNQATASQQVTVTADCASSLASVPAYPSDEFVSPTQGSSTTDFAYRVIYTDESGSLPAIGYPRVELDANGDGDAWTHWI